MTAGTMLLDAAAQAGLYGLMVRTSGPQIRGGEAAALLRLATTPHDRSTTLRPARSRSTGRTSTASPTRSRCAPYGVVVGDAAQRRARPQVFLPAARTSPGCR